MKQFILLSSLDVYGAKPQIITKDRAPSPETDYAGSKYEADQKITALEDDNFPVCIVRSPVVYDNKQPGLLDRISSLTSKRFINRRTERSYIDRV